MSGLATASSEFLRLFRQALEAYDSGDLERAHELFVQAQETEPDNVWALLWCGATAPTPEETITWLEQVLAMDPGNPHAEAGLAWARERVEQATQEAKRAAEEAALAEAATEEEAAQLEEWATEGGAPAVEEQALPGEEEKLLTDQGAWSEEVAPEFAGEEATVAEVPEETAPNAEADTLTAETEDVWPTGEEVLLDIDEEDIPDWLRGEEPGAAVAEEEAEVAEAEWLQEAEAEVPTAEAEAELPDWLAGEGEAQAPETVKLPEAPPEGSLPPPNDVVAAYQAGLAAWEENRLEEAARYFEQTVRLDPNHVQAYDYLGSVYFLLGQSDKAVQAYKRALSIDPNYAESYFNLGLVYQEMGDRENAIAMFEKYLELDPDSSFAENARMFLQQLRGQ